MLFLLRNLICLGLIVFTQSAAGNCILKGEILGVENGLLEISLFKNVDEFYRDTIKINEGSFYFSIFLENTVVAKIRLLEIPYNEQDQNECYIALEPRLINLYLVKHQFKGRYLKGVEEQKFIYEFENRIKAIQDELAIMNVTKSRIADYNENNNQVMDSIQQKMMKFFDDEMVSLRFKLDEEIIKYIREHNFSYYALSQLFYMRESLPFDVSKIKEIYNSFPPQIKKSHEGVQLSRYLNAWPPNRAIEFDGVTQGGNKLAFPGDFEKRVVLIDFWASWCVPCRADNPGLIKLYRKYFNDGLEIISVSRDDKNVDAWKRAIEVDSIGEWNHINENAWEKSAANLLYGVTAIPVKILIDKNGFIVYRSIGSGLNDLEDKLKELFGY